MNEELKAILEESMNHINNIDYLIAVKRVIETGNINSQDEYGNSILFMLMRTKDVELVKVLLEHGADVNLKNNAGNTPLMFAIAFENLEIIRELLKKGADIKIRNNENICPLQYALNLEHTAILRLFKEQGEEKGRSL